MIPLGTNLKIILGYSQVSNLFFSNLTISLLLIYIVRLRKKVGLWQFSQKPNGWLTWVNLKV